MFIKTLSLVPRDCQVSRSREVKLALQGQQVLMKRHSTQRSNGGKRLPGGRHRVNTSAQTAMYGALPDDVKLEMASFLPPAEMLLALGSTDPGLRDPIEVRCAKRLAPGGGCWQKELGIWEEECGQVCESTVTHDLLDFVRQGSQSRARSPAPPIPISMDLQSAGATRPEDQWRWDAESNSDKPFSDIQRELLWALPRSHRVSLNWLPLSPGEARSSGNLTRQFESDLTALRLACPNNEVDEFMGSGLEPPDRVVGHRLAESCGRGVESAIERLAKNATMVDAAYRRLNQASSELLPVLSGRYDTEAHLDHELLNVTRRLPSWLQRRWARANDEADLEL